MHSFQKAAEVSDEGTLSLSSDDVNEQINIQTVIEETKEIKERHGGSVLTYFPPELLKIMLQYRSGNIKDFEVDDTIRLLHTGNAIRKAINDAVKDAKKNVDRPTIVLRIIQYTPGDYPGYKSRLLAAIAGVKQIAGRVYRSGDNRVDVTLQGFGTALEAAADTVVKFTTENHAVVAEVYTVKNPKTYRTFQVDIPLKGDARTDRSSDCGEIDEKNEVDMLSTSSKSSMTALLLRQTNTTKHELRLIARNQKKVLQVVNSIKHQLMGGGVQSGGVQEQQTQEQTPEQKAAYEEMKTLDMEQLQNWLKVRKLSENAIKTLYNEEYTGAGLLTTNQETLKVYLKSGAVASLKAIFKDELGLELK